MGRLARTLVLSALACLALATTAAAQDPARIGTKVVEVADRDAKATCRVAGGPCQQEASQQAIDDFTGSWTHRALLFQHALGNDVGMANAPWAATHNSYNSIEEMGPALSTVDSNQQIGMTEQLDIGIRSLEIDVHLFAGRPVVCHARGANEGHAGCSVERELAPVLDEIGTWLRAHPREVVMLYLEDHMENAAGYDAATAAVDRELGDVLYRPTVSATGTGCAKLGTTLTRDDMLARGKNAFVVSDCGPGAGWRTVAFDWGADHVETQPKDYTAFPACGDDFSRSVYDATLVRYYEDSTGLSAGVAQMSGGEENDPLTVATTRAMARCGVDHIGFDQLVPGDGRLGALVWSWDASQPAASGGCAVQRTDERWESRMCGQKKRVAACRRADGSWTTSRKAVRLDDAEDACARERATFAAPRTGYENALLRRAAGDAPVLLGLTRPSGGTFAPVDAR